jgi:hypothetical protein
LGGFRSALSGATKKNTTLGQVIKVVDAQCGFIDRVEKDRAALRASEQEMDKASIKAGDRQGGTNGSA